MSIGSAELQNFGQITSCACATRGLVLKRLIVVQQPPAFGMLPVDGVGFLCQTTAFLLCNIVKLRARCQNALEAEHP